MSVFDFVTMASKKSYESGRKYNKLWEDKYLWVIKATDGSENAFCKLCRVVLAPKTSRLADHEKSKKHLDLISASKFSLPLPFTVIKNKIPDETKYAELEFAVGIACHCATSNVDHLSEIIKNRAKGSALEHIKLHRTKCSKLISRVIAPSIFEKLRDDISNSNFSILVDEATDVATQKSLLCFTLLL